ncbi:MAG: hypothetical protein ICV66_06655 [Chitinophagaceae bacterium]|nr:hypothetical protein [Chitinophagaceae bacterium]
MTSKVILSLFIVTLFFSCEFIDNKIPSREHKKEMTYSYACLDSTVSGEELNKIIRKGGDIIRDIAVDKSSITDEVQNQYGAEFHKDAIESGIFKLLKDATIGAHLNQTLRDLFAAREKPSAIKYFIYAVDDTSINAFTFGGRIYITKKCTKHAKARQHCYMPLLDMKSVIWVYTSTMNYNRSH